MVKRFGQLPYHVHMSVRPGTTRNWIKADHGGWHHYNRNINGMQFVLTHNPYDDDVCMVKVCVYGRYTSDTDYMPLKVAEVTAGSLQSALTQAKRYAKAYAFGENYTFEYDN